MIGLAETQTIDLDPERHLQLRLSVGLQDHLVEEDPCLMMKYRLRSFSIGFLEVEEWEVLLVSCMPAWLDF